MQVVIDTSITGSGDIDQLIKLGQDLINLVSLGLDIRNNNLVNVDMFASPIMYKLIKNKIHSPGGSQKLTMQNLPEQSFLLLYLTPVLHAQPSGFRH